MSIYCPDPCPEDPCELSCVDEPSRPCQPCGVAMISACPAGERSDRSVLLHSGQFVFAKDLLSVDAIGGLGWSLGLKYLSGAGVDGLLGRGWDMPQHASLRPMEGGGVQLLGGDQTRQAFFPNGDGTYSSEHNHTMAELVRLNADTAGETFRLTSSAGVVSEFFGFHPDIATPGRLQRTADRDGSERTYSWVSTDGVAQLASESDAYGRSVSYQYYGAAYGRRLREVEDSLGRKLNFQYDPEGRLVAAVLPSILKAADGNTFPGGVAYVFEYDTANAAPERQDDLIRIWFPNQVRPHLDTQTRQVDVAAVYDPQNNATPRYTIEYGQYPGDQNHYGRVVRETVGDPAGGVGGSFTYAYTGGLSEESVFYDPQDPKPQDRITSRTVMTDRNGNETVCSFNAQGMPLKKEARANRGKNSLQSGSWVTWTRYNAENQEVLKVFPEGNSVEYEYDDGAVAGISGTYIRRRGLLTRETHKPGNGIGVPSRAGGGGQSELTRRYFYEPLFNQRCAVIERRGNPIDGSGGYFTPQNGGATPTDADRSRYATITTFDYQKDTTATVSGDAALRERLGLTASQVQALINHVDQQMIGGGLPAGFEMGLGDVNGDGTGEGTARAAAHRGHRVKVRHPAVRSIGSDAITAQERVELFTVNGRGQSTTHTDPEGNVTAYVRYPESDPEGDGQNVNASLSNKQYGRMKEVHVDVDPAEVMSLIGADGDLDDFVVSGVAPRDGRTNTPGVYQDLVTRYEGGGAGGACASCSYDVMGNALAVTDPRGFTTTYERNELGEVYRTIAPAPYLYTTETHYDANRNAVRVDVEDKAVQYDSEDPASAGYAKFTPTGGGGVAHVPTKTGPGGSVRPGWFTSFYEYDLLDNRTEEDLDAVGSTPSSLVTSYAYDANENLVEATRPEGNTIEYDYDERNLRIAERVGRDDAAGEPGSLTLMAYDGNGNLIEAVGPAARGAAGNHRTVTIADAFGSGADLVHTGDWAAQHVYDGFDRMIRSVDAVGHETLAEHDPDGRVVEATRRGPVGGPTPADRSGSGNVDLARSLSRFDEAGRGYENQQDVFVADGVSLPSGRSVAHTGGGLEANATADGHTASETLVSAGSATAHASYVLSRSVHDRAGRLVERVEDNTAVTTFAYDGAGRRIKQTDALGNLLEYELDADGHVTQATRTEKCTIAGGAGTNDEMFRSKMRYDALGRLVIQAEQGADGTIGNDPSDPSDPGDTQTLFTLIGYDSRGNQTNRIDPKGNTSLSVYDGAGRALEVHEHLRVDGQGSNGPLPNKTFTPAGGSVVATISRYDGNGRVSKLIDDRGGTTTYSYDTLDRQVQMAFHDGATRDSAYNAASDVIQYTDENGSVFDSAFDPLGRRTAVSITRAAGVVGTDSQSFEYDGLSRRTKSVDAVGADEAVVEMFYDALGRVLEDTQSYDGRGRYATHTAFASLPVAELTYPNGRGVVHTHDPLYRRTDVGDSGGPSIASWAFYGPARIAEVQLGNGLIQSHLNNARDRSAVQEGQPTPGWGDDASDRLGYDGAGRMIAKRYLGGGVDASGGAYNDTAAVVGFTTEYDPASNKRYERHLHAENRSHLYEPMVAGTPQGGYDSMDRLRQYQRGTLDTGGGSVLSPIAVPGADEERSYALDHLGNWAQTAHTPVGGTQTTETRTHNKLNQTTQRDDGAATNLSYDLSGNLTDDGERLYAWDALNRLMEVKRSGDDAVVGQYAYDAQGRRVRKTVASGGLSGSIANGTSDYLYSGWQCVEERNNADNPTKQYVWGTYIDELIQQRDDRGGTPVDHYAAQNPNYNVFGLTDSSANIAEAYDYTPYGRRLVFTAPGSGGDWWADDANQAEQGIGAHGHQGLRHDEETGLTYNRARMLHPVLGRFTQRDPIGYVDGMGLYEYVESNPSNGRDQSGTHRDFNPGRSQPPQIPEHHIRWDFSEIWPNTAHLRLYDFYTRLTYWATPDGASAEWAILGGAFLADVRGQSQLVDLRKFVARKLRLDAKAMLIQLGVGDVDTFEDGGSRLITADLMSTNVRLSLQRFTVWWNADCRIGPKRPGPEEGCRATYNCSVIWTLYDKYDFRWWEPYAWLGHPFHIYASWGVRLRGTVHER